MAVYPYSIGASMESLVPEKCKYCGGLLQGQGRRRCESLSCQVMHQRHLVAGGPCCRSCARPLRHQAGHQETCGRVACRAIYARNAGRRNENSLWCSVCKVLLQNSRLGLELCGDSDCQAVWQRQVTAAKADRKHRQRLRLLELAGQARDGLAQAHGREDQRRLPIALVPHTDAPLAAPDPSRVAAICNHIVSLVTKAVCQPPMDSDEPRDLSSYHPDSTPTEDVVFRNCCRLCRGDCCEAGGDHAFLSIKTMRRVREAQPELSPNAIVSRYVDHLPPTSLVGSCIFHGALGCSLPREMRADLCNRFLCKGLLETRQILSQETPAAIFVASATETEIAAHEFITCGCPPDAQNDT